MKVRNKFLFIAIFLNIFIAFHFSACSGNSEVNTQQQIRITEHNLSIHKFGGDVLQSLATVEGNAENTANIIIDRATITISFYDKNNNLLQISSTIKQNWSPGEIWSFTVKFNGPDAWKTTRYTISTSIE